LIASADSPDCVRWGYGHSRTRQVVACPKLSRYDSLISAAFVGADFPSLLIGLPDYCSVDIRLLCDRLPCPKQNRHDDEFNKPSINAAASHHRLASPVDLLSESYLPGSDSKFGELIADAVSAE
jgi:hypothetical protein